jgi:hypothetical protein
MTKNEIGTIVGQAQLSCSTERFELCRQAVRSLLQCAEAKLGADDEAGADVCFANGGYRCAPWRAKRRRVVPGSRERRDCFPVVRAARQRGRKASIRARRRAIVGVLCSQRRVQRWCGGAARTQGGRSTNRRSKIECVLGTWTSQNASRDRRHACRWAIRPGGCEQGPTGYWCRKDSVSCPWRKPHKVTSSGGRSSIRGKSSSNGSRESSTASKDVRATGSITSRVPSLRMMAALPGNSNLLPVGWMPARRSAVAPAAKLFFGNGLRCII